MLPEGRPPIDSSNAPIPLLIFAIFSLRLLVSLLVLPVGVLALVPLLVSCFVGGCLFHLNPLFHYLSLLGYWDVTSRDFGARVTAGFGAFSRYCCGGACRGLHSERRLGL